MSFDMKSFVESLVEYLNDCDMVPAEALKVGETTALIMTYDEDGDEASIGNHAEPGLEIEYVGKLNDQDMVRVNSIIISAFPKHVAAWVFGYNLI